MEPTELVFWGALSVAVGAGVLVVHPVTVWMVSKGPRARHGLGAGPRHDGRSVEAESRRLAGAPA